MSNGGHQQGQTCDSTVSNDRIHAEEPPPFDSHREYFTRSPVNAPNNSSRPPRYPSHLDYGIRHVASVDQADTTSILPPYSARSPPYKSSRTEEEYLSALRAFLEARQLVDVEPNVGRGLVGFYGDRTMEERNKRLQDERQRRKAAKAVTKQSTPARESKGRINLKLGSFMKGRKSSSAVS